MNYAYELKYPFPKYRLSITVTIVIVIAITKRNKEIGLLYDQWIIINGLLL